MRIHLNGEAHPVPEQFLEKVMSDLLQEGVKDYQEKIPKGWRIAAQAISRMVLEKMERDAVAQIGKEQAKAVLRPVRGEDPNLRLAQVFSRILLKGLSYVDLYIATGDSGAIDTFNFTVEQGAGQAGRQVDFDRNERLRENHSPQIP